MTILNTESWDLASQDHSLCPVKTEDRSIPFYLLTLNGLEIVHIHASDIDT